MQMYSTFFLPRCICPSLTKTVVTFKPCGHFVLCEACAKRVKICPTCKVFKFCIVHYYIMLLLYLQLQVETCRILQLCAWCVMKLTPCIQLNLVVIVQVCIYNMWPYLTKPGNPAYGICTLFTQCTFLVSQVKNVKVEFLSYTCQRTFLLTFTVVYGC